MDAVLGVMAATVISLLNVAALTIWAMVGAANVQSAVTAAHMRVWDAGALQYVKDFASTIAATATATTPVTVTTAMMAAAGNYLPLGYSGVNPFGQTLELQVLQPTAGQLQAIVTSQGGRSISDPKQLVQIAAQAQAGFVPYNNQNGDATMNAGNDTVLSGHGGPLRCRTTPIQAVAISQPCWRSRVPAHRQTTPISIVCPYRISRSSITCKRIWG